MPKIEKSDIKEQMLVLLRWIYHKSTTITKEPESLQKKEGGVVQVLYGDKSHDGILL